MDTNYSYDRNDDADEDGNPYDILDSDGDVIASVRTEGEAETLIQHLNRCE